MCLQRQINRRNLIAYRLTTKLSYATRGRSKLKTCYRFIFCVKQCVVTVHCLPNYLEYVVRDLLQRKSSRM